MVKDDDGKKYVATKDLAPSTTHPKNDTGLLGNWSKAEEKDTAVVAAFVLATASSRVTGTSSVDADTGDVSVTSNIKTSVTSHADATSGGSGAGIAVAVMVTSSEAYVDSTASTPVKGKSLTVSADTDNAAPTTGTSSPKGAKGSNDQPANDPTQKAKTKIKGGQVLGATVTVVTTGGFTTSGGTFTVDGGTGSCAYTGVTEDTFTGVTGCSGTVADGAVVAGSSKQSQAAGGKADNQSKTSDGNQNLSAALAVVVLVVNTHAHISPATAATISVHNGTVKVHSGSKNNASATADAGNVSSSPAAPTLTAGTGGSLAAGTYYYKLTAVTADGESLAGPEAHVESPRPARSTSPGPRSPAPPATRSTAVRSADDLKLDHAQRDQRDDLQR